MYICVCVSCPTTDPDGPRRVYVTGNRSSVHVFFFVTNACIDYRLHGCIVCECMESLCVYIVVHAHRANAFIRACVCMGTGRWEWMDGWMRGIRAFTSSVVDARGDGRSRETHRARPSTSFASNASLPRLSRSLSLSLSNDEFIHSLIHSVANERTNERRDERTNERPDALERDARERRTRSTRSFASNSARARRGTRVCLERTTHRTHRIARAF